MRKLGKWSLGPSPFSLLLLGGILSPMRNEEPWKFLDEYRGRYFEGTWPALPCLFEITATRFPDRPCFTVFAPERQTLNYRQAQEAVYRIAAFLQSKGIQKGDHVAVTGRNSPSWALAYFGILSAGAVVVPIDWQLPVQDIASLMRAGDVRAAFVDDEKFEDLQQLVSEIPCYGLWQAAPEGLPTLSAPDDFVFEKPALSEKDLAAILFTSGTMGSPKGVMLTHGNLVSDCFLAQANLNIGPTDVFYALLPLHHSYTMLAVFIESVSVGAETVFGKRLVVKQILSDLREAKVTMFLGVPMLFNKLLNGIMKGIREKGPLVYGAVRIMMGLSGFIKKTTGINPGKLMFRSILEKASLASIRICISGGGPLDPAVFKAYNELGIDFVQGYGLTETSPILTLNPVEHYKETSVGKVIPGVEMRIEHPDSEGIGEIVVRGPMVMQGYYRMPEETASVLSSDGWLHTGDLGWLDDEQYLYLAGRLKNLIVTEGGKNVYPEEIENAFQMYEPVEQIMVRGYIPEGKTCAEEIEALIYPSQEWIAQEHLAPDQVREKIAGIVSEVNQKLRPYQRISRITILDEALEMTTTRKVKRQTVVASGQSLMV